MDGKVESGMRGMKDKSLGWSSIRLEGCWVPYLRIYISMAFIFGSVILMLATRLVLRVESSCGVGDIIRPSHYGQPGLRPWLRRE
jgi:hypothetical protein